MVVELRAIDAAVPIAIELWKTELHVLAALDHEAAGALEAEGREHGEEDGQELAALVGLRRLALAAPVSRRFSLHISSRPSCIRK